MQSFNELFAIIRAGRPDISDETIKTWCYYLGQLKGCRLYSVASPEKDESEWLRHRRVGIGGSEISAIMGENEWNSPRQIWMGKMGMFDDKPVTQSEAARWGNLLETTVANEWAYREKRQYIHIPVILVDEEKEYLMANIDGFTLTDDRQYITGILEIKTTSAYNDEAWSVGPLPFNYICQVNWYCGITRLENYTIVCLVGGQKLYYYDMPADPNLFNREVEEADKFWLENVQKGIEPAATHVDIELVKDEPRNDELPALIISDEGQNRLIEAYVNLRAEESKIKKLKEGIYAQLFIMLGQHTQAISSERALRIKETVRRNCLWDVLRQKYPAAYEECIYTTVSHSLEVK